jgi:hypothetical protein
LTYAEHFKVREAQDQRARAKGIAERYVAL